MGYNGSQKKKNKNDGKGRNRDSGEAIVRIIRTGSLLLNDEDF